MSLPHLLLVDDSDAVLAFEKAALAAHYRLSTAGNGVEALESLARARPDAVLLDLSMPEMDGEEVFSRMRADAALREIPVVVVSSERARGEKMVRAGARAFVAKPFRATDLEVTVTRVLDAVRHERARRNLPCLFVEVGPFEMALPLDTVRLVVAHPSTLPLPSGLPELSQFELHGAPLLVLDVALRLAVPHEQPLVERKIVVLEKDGTALGLAVDRVRDPEEVEPSRVTQRERLGGSGLGDLDGTLIAMVRTVRGHVPVIAPRALFDATHLDAALSLVRDPPVVP